MAAAAASADAPGAPGGRPFPEIPGVEIEHRFVEVSGLRFHVAMAGPPDAEPLLLLHGWPQHWYEWRGVLPQLARTRRCIAPDLRGLGWSDAPASGYEKEQLASDILAILDVLEVERTDLIAHDWGGWVGFLIALRAPERLGRYLALNIPPPWSSDRRDPRPLLGLWRLWYQVVLATPGLGSSLVGREQVMARMLRAGQVQQDAFSDEDVRIFAAALAEPARAHASARYYRDFLLREVPAILRGRYDRQPLEVSTHLLFGVHDLAIDRSIVELSVRPGDPLTVEFVEDSGHFIADELPELVLARAASFLGI